MTVRSRRLWTRPATVFAVMVSLLAVIPSAPLSAEDWYVDDGGDCANGDGGPENPFCLVQDAIDAAQDGDTILIAAGTYLEHLVLEKDLRLIGVDGADRTIVDGSDSGRVMTVAAGADNATPTVEVEAMTLTRGSSVMGGGLSVDDASTVTLVRVRVVENRAPNDYHESRAGRGGGIYSTGHLTIVECRIEANEADSHEFGTRRWCCSSRQGSGGGIYQDGGVLTLSRTEVSSNSVPDGSGGGMCVHQGTTAVIDCDFRWNTAHWGGAASTVGDVSIHDSTISGNRAVTSGHSYNYTGAGGGIDNSGALTIQSSTISRNWATGTAGGIFDRGELVLTDVNISENEKCGIYTVDGTLRMSRSIIAGNRGGGLVHRGGGFLLTDCAIVGNVSASSGGGIYTSRGVGRLQRSTVAGNSARDSGGGIKVVPFHDRTDFIFDGSIIAGNASPTGPDASGILNSNNGYNLVGDTADCTFTGNQKENLYDVDPRFRDPDAGDYSLAESSPCLDSGRPGLRRTGTDVAGNPRVLDGDLDRIMVLDRGGYEFNNVHLEVTGDATPGGTLTFETTGKPGLIALLFVGAAPGEVFLKPYGLLLLDVSQPYEFFPFAVIPDTKDVVVPPGLQGPLDLVLQELATGLRSKAGNFSNAVKLRIE